MSWRISYSLIHPSGDIDTHHRVYLGTGYILSKRRNKEEVARGGGDDDDDGDGCVKFRSGEAGMENVLGWGRGLWLRFVIVCVCARARMFLCVVLACYVGWGEASRVPGPGSPFQNDECVWESETQRLANRSMRNGVGVVRLCTGFVIHRARRRVSAGFGFGL